MNELILFPVAVIAIFLSGCTQNPATANTSIASPQALCHIVNDSLPDPNCTPGSVNPSVTQQNIKSTICAAGFTSSVRPTENYTEPLKLQSIRQYGYYDKDVADYEYDHRVPLEIAGDPTNISNLWAEPHYTTISSYDKDKVENLIHDQVCNGSMTLKQGQNVFLTDKWLQYIKK